MSRVRYIGDTRHVKPQLLSSVAAAVARVGGTAIRVSSGYRSPSHNRAVGGVSHSNHTTGDALDGYALIRGRWVPLGVALKGDAGAFGLRSGDQPGFYNGGPDLVHVDDGANVGGAHGGGAPMNGEAAIIARLARRYGVDPNAALAIASVEGGFGGAIGDHGTSFGPFQLHRGGALPRGVRNPAQWANSQAGINYAMQRIAGVAQGLHGRQAVTAISSRFERPANVSGEIQNAMSHYGQGGFGGMGSFGGAGGGPQSFPGPGGAPDNSKLVLSLVQKILSSNAKQKQFTLPTAVPVQRSLYPPMLGGS